jgi:hypothetical protein
MRDKLKHLCPCCGYKTLDKEPPGTFDICPVCYWEDDNIQFDNPLYEGGANEMSLEKARLNFKKFGAVDKKYLKNVRSPFDEEK